MADLQAHEEAAPRPEMTDAGLDAFITRMRDVRHAEDKLASALECMTSEDDPPLPTAENGTVPSRGSMRKPKMRRCRPLNARHFSEAAREGARAARKAKALLQEDIATPKVFIVRHGSPSTPFAWEIRRFGGVVLIKSDIGFPSLRTAWVAGEAMLAASPPS